MAFDTKTVRRPRRTTLFILLLAFAFLFTACSDSLEWDYPKQIDPAAIATDIGDEDLHGYRIADDTTDTFAIVMADGGAMIVRMDAESAPKTVEHIQTLIGAGFYDGLLFHRVVRDFVIQGGDPNGDGTGGSGKSIKGEFPDNGVNNPLEHERGVISMGRMSGDSKESYNSADSQFFFCLNDLQGDLDGAYAPFGHIVEGLDTMDRIGAVDTAGMNTRPVDDQVMLRVFFVESEN